MATAYLVLGSPPQESDHLDLLDDLLWELKERLQIDIIYQELVPRGEHLVEHRYLGEDEAVQVSLANDSKTPVDYLMVTAPHDLAPALVTFLKDHLPVVEPEELRNRARERAADDPGVLVALAIAASDPDEETEFLIRQALQSPEENLRHAAIEAAALTSWPTLLSPLVHLYLNHPETDTRLLAGRSVQALIGACPAGGSPATHTPAK
ncbi:hypothetical protein [Nonomuraea mesophila]|uniref:hypothetical protein n=1 Tax=Nonomuraea mesophila TaxID=2530382 RepID=UPI001C707C5A|nr:hypothetical protein [Nonomuraea mesophila]